MQVKKIPWGQTGDLAMRSKGQIHVSLNVTYGVNFKDF